MNRRFGFGQLIVLIVVLLSIAALALPFIVSIPVLIRGGAFFGVCILVLGAQRVCPSLFEPPKARVEVDERGVRRFLPAGKTEAVAWDDLIKVSIMTTDEGPAGEDLFWMLHARDGHGCAVPHEQACALGLLDRLQWLPGFDNIAVIQASGSTQWAEFVCWEGAPGEARAAATRPAAADGDPSPTA